MSAVVMRRPGVVVLIAGVFAVVAVQLLVPYLLGVAPASGDTDDAMRLVQVRAFLAGRGWFDLHEERLGGLAGYDTHWSRLIDAGLAGLHRIAELFVAPPVAERVAGVVWPLVWLGVALAAVIALADRLGGFDARLAVAVLAVLGLPAYQQFVPGRIDHHNVQIALAVVVLAATAWADRRVVAAPIAGAATALALAIGFESVAFLAPCGLAFAIRAVIDPNSARSLAGYGTALALGTVAMVLVGVPSSRLAVTACEVLAVNTAAPVVLAGLLLAGLGLLAPQLSVGLRLASLALTAMMSAALALALEPRCIGGPFALMDPRVWAVWLSGVRESQSLDVLWRSEPMVVATIVAFPLVAWVAVVRLVREADRRADPAVLITAIVFVVAALLTVKTAKLYAYAMWFGMPLVAAAAARAWRQPWAASLVVRVFLVLMLAPAVVGAAAGALTARFAGRPASEHVSGPTPTTCFAADDYARLATLPPGRVVTEIDYGPFVLAHTPHAVLAAPYHRLSTAILTNDRIQTSPPEVARPLLEDAGVAYVAVCDNAAPPSAAAGDGLLDRLRRGDVPAWLAPVPPPAGAPAGGFAIYRVLRDPAPTSGERLRPAIPPV